MRKWRIVRRLRASRRVARTGETRQDADEADMPADAAGADRLRQSDRSAHFDDMINTTSIGPV